MLGTLPNVLMLREVTLLPQRVAGAPICARAQDIHARSTGSGVFGQNRFPRLQEAVCRGPGDGGQRRQLALPEG